MDLTNIFMIAMMMVAIVLAVSEILKKTFNLNTQYMPITSVVIGIFIGLVLWPLAEYPMYVMLMAGFIAGLTASGTFDLLKAAKKEGEQ
ncbi:MULTISPECIES: holin [Lysinibacillus]|uniref:Holin n=1 Tax=Lysinibacillus irui TaxID=2998077 RepID=A0AAJ5UQ38_9BACI|nr:MULTISPECIES: holin [Lysinibacillus]WDV05051.1 holin [Lysinibacillus irui]